MATGPGSSLWSWAIDYLRLLWRIARELFHETTGALFAFFSLAGWLSAWRHWRRGGVPWDVGLAIGFALMMLAFAVGSFRSARRVR
jgi:uncharacterized membrane protein YfcA